VGERHEVPYRVFRVAVGRKRITAKLSPKIASRLFPILEAVYMDDDVANVDRGAAEDRRCPLKRKVELSCSFCFQHCWIFKSQVLKTECFL
jgi:hypothetical protein